MNWKCIVLGAVIYFVVTNIIGIAVTGPLIHEGVLDPVYQETETFWRPELHQDPPDMAALLPMWLLNGFIFSLVVGWLYCLLGSCLAGSGWIRGLKFGLCLAVFASVMMLAWSGIFDLPSTLWIWWAVDNVIYFALGAIVMGWAVGKWGGEAAAAG